MPREYDPYCAHVRVRFASEFKHLKTLNASFKAKGGEALQQNQTLEVDETELAELKAKFEDTPPTG